METAILYTVGPSTMLLAQYLAQHHDWKIDRVQQITSQRGIIVGRHDNPHEFLAFGINEGTRVHSVEVPEHDEEPAE